MADGVRSMDGAGTGGGRRSRATTGVLVAATVAAGLMAGTFYVFACAVMPALARSDDRVYVDVMRDVNDVIQNPVFLLVFMAAPVLAGVAAWRLRGSPGRRWAWAGAVAAVAAFLVTVACNVPLNDGLAGAGDPAVLRERFEDPWVAWNVVRTLLSSAALTCLSAAAVTRARAGRAGDFPPPA
ncbi:anthrone oxygenase family protein [Streptomyces sp. SID5910]|uniref:anthrone oxygenase family protein n=1 Tax=Streptomyces sp. SID5910 TaxID=2690312 RepID=UPI001F3FC1D1|nr:anthrone oxygenase family protein [Streptomyces sp. SID5910]